MVDDPEPAGSAAELSTEERERIRAEMRYAVVAAREAATGGERKGSFFDKAMGFLSNGFVLLLLGALITSGLVPYFQRQYESSKQRYALMQECLGQFLLYSNSIWQEYYSIIPLTQEVEIDKETYLHYTRQIADIKLKRYDAYAKVQALAIVFRDTNAAQPSSVEHALKSYAVRLNNASGAIDQWLTGLYCTPTNREESPCATFDPAFDGFTEYEKIKKLVLDIGNTQSDDVAALIVGKMKEGE